MSPVLKTRKLGEILRSNVINHLKYELKVYFLGLISLSLFSASIPMG